MIDLRVILDGEGCWPEIGEWERGEIKEIARLTEGMVSGKSSVAVKIVLESGKIVWAETSFNLLRNAVRAMEIAEDGGAKVNIGGGSNG